FAVHSGGRMIPTQRSVMQKLMRRVVVAFLFSVAVSVAILSAQQQGGLSAADKARRWEMENELQSIATIERKAMMPMPDGVRLATDIYRPKNAGPTSKVP